MATAGTLMLATMEGSRLVERLIDASEPRGLDRSWLAVVFAAEVSVIMVVFAATVGSSSYSGGAVVRRLDEGQVWQ